MKEIIKLIFKYKKEDDKLQEASDAYFDLYAPDSYPPFVGGKASVALKVLELLDKDMEEWTSYFIYEAKSFYPNCDITWKDKEYTITCEEEAIEFLINFND